MRQAAAAPETQSPPLDRRVSMRRHRHLRSGRRPPPISLTQVKRDATIKKLAVPAIAQGAYHAADGHECLVSLEQTDGALHPYDTH